MKIALATAIVVAYLVSCAHRQEWNARTSPGGNDYTGIVRVGRGTACSYNGNVGPPSYRVEDIGKPGVAGVSRSDRRMLAIILRYVHSKTLRFAYVANTFSVFDATAGPCAGTQYAVLTASGCNMIYVPFDNSNDIFAAPGGCNMKARPWIPHDRGNPHGLSWTDYGKPTSY